MKKVDRKIMSWKQLMGIVCFLVLLFFLDKKVLHILKDSGNINIDLIKKISYYLLL